MKTTKPAARCADCDAPTPAAWLDAEGSCPWCAAAEARDLAVLDAEDDADLPPEPRECSKCGGDVLPAPYHCPCSRATRERLDDAEYEVEEREALERDGGS